MTSAIDSPSWFWAAAGLSFLAMLGGAVVLRGLWLEGYKKPENFKDVTEQRRHEEREKLGIKRVFWGVFIEVIVAFLLTFKEGWEAHEMAVEIEANKPLNQPVQSIKLTVYLDVVATFFSTEAFATNMGGFAHPPTVGRTAVPLPSLLGREAHIPGGRSSISDVVLLCDRFEYGFEDIKHPNERTFALTFSWPNASWTAMRNERDGIVDWITEKRLAAKTWDELFQSLKTDLPNTFARSQVVEGWCELTINGFMHRRYFAEPFTDDAGRAIFSPANLRDNPKRK